MNKAQLVEAVALDANISKVEVQKTLDAMIRISRAAIRGGDKLTLSGFGTFSVQQAAARIGRNPRTGATVKIPPRKVVKFRSSIEVE